MNNLNNPHIVKIKLGASAGKDMGAWFPKDSVILSAAVVSSTAVAQSDTNYVDVQLQDAVAGTVYAELSTKVTKGSALAVGALVAYVPTLMGLAPATYPDSAPSDLVVPAGSFLAAVVAEGGSGALSTDAELHVQYYPL